MIASLPMYETPHTRAAHDIYWQAIRDTYGRGPKHLSRDLDPHDCWERHDLILSQTCGLPYRSGLHASVLLVGTPDYGVADCPPGYYRSHFIVRSSDERMQITDFAGARFARNDVRSQSGWAAAEQHLIDHKAGFSFATNCADTKAHRASAEAVSTGMADIAAIDAVTWALLERDTDLTAALRVLISTAPTPGLPYICARGQDPQALFGAISKSVAGLEPHIRAALMIKNIVHIPASAYLAVPLPPTSG
ncbi:phosphate/phosphite/phosphonate ABC transporter substrate-binding protein [Roseobacter litoralis]|uniref:phosphate/phosphite/phosphonate ABC transporter substrate-binding protein n=1 Tax=Roseobacter litoralis TaxID=42443 RepID=UPI00249499C7|nr:PhnD/SsuA/transferrin family substrate-binding protein [Roseobacter litoralis]